MLAATVAYHCRWIPEETIAALRQIEPFKLYLLPAACRQCCMYDRGETKNAPQGHFMCSSWGDAAQVATALRMDPTKVVQVAGPWYGDYGWRQVVAIPERMARALRGKWWEEHRLRAVDLQDDDTWR